MNITRFINFSSAARRKVIFNSHYGFKTCSNEERRIINYKRLFNLHTRYVSTCEIKGEKKEDSLANKVLNKIPFVNFKKLRISATAYVLYEGFTDQVNYIEFFEECELPDTFYSWFVITELYIWMLSVRAMAEGEDGRYIRNGLVEAFWLDVAQRVKKLGAGSISVLKEQVYELSEQLQAALLAYDEGLQSNDIVLAGAIWRRFYQSETVNPENLVKIVKFIRKQITLLDNISSNQIFEEKSIKWQTIKDIK